MTKFVFTVEDEDGKSSIEFEAEAWPDAFPKFLQVMRGAGFNVSNDVRLYAPQLSNYIFGDREYLISAGEINECENLENLVQEPGESDDPSSW